MLRMDRKGFGRMEVLVVAVVTVFLVLIILSVGTKARLRARVTLCRSNLQEWGRILQAYAANHDGKFPSHAVPEGGLNASDIAVATKEVLEEYGAKCLWMCPAAPSIVIDEMREYYDASEQSSAIVGGNNSGFYVIPGYFLWIPRPVAERTGTLLPLREVFPEKDIVTGNPFPQGTGDGSAKYLPVMTDIVFKQKLGNIQTAPGDFGELARADYCSPDLSDEAPVDMNWKGVFGEGRLNGVYATHVESHQVINVNRLFADGRVEMHPASEVKTRYVGSYQNLY